MKLNTVFLIHAIVLLVFGLGYFFVPEQAASTLGISLDPGGVYVARTTGALLLGLALTSWFVRRLNETDAIRAVVPAYFGGVLVTCIAALWGQLSGLPNASGWANVVITGLFTLAYAYFLFLKR